MQTTINLTEFGSIVGGLLVVGGILKHAFPGFPNRFIPLTTWLLGVIAYMVLSKGWTEPAQWLAAIMAAASATGVHSTLKNTLSGSDPASGGNAPAAKIPLIAWLLAAGLAGATVTGCQSTGKTLATTAQTVDAAMQGWAEYVAAGQASASDEARVKSAYQKYQTAFAAAKAIYDTGSTTNGAALNSAVEILRAQRASLIALVNQLIPPKK